MRRASSSKAAASAVAPASKLERVETRNKRLQRGVCQGSGGGGCPHRSRPPAGRRTGLRPREGRGGGAPLCPGFPSFKARACHRRAAAGAVGLCGDSASAASLSVVLQEPLWTPAGLGRNGIGAAGAEGDAPGGEKMRPEMGSSPARAGRTSCSACRPVQGWTRLLAGFPKLTVLPVDIRGETPKKTPSGLSEGEEARPVRVLAYFSSNPRGR